LVLHRDIKSANVLVDSHGQPRVLDFGIAKMPEADGKSSTTDGPRFFSLACAAPEQVLGAPISAATDVYAVGVLLYELLTGVPPLPFDGVSARASLEMAVDRVPPLASAACAALPAERAAELAQQRGLRPGAWVQALRGDLDVILACALRKEPRARYPTATAFAADLTAALQLRPITARSNERWYRVGRFVRRHAIAVALTSALLLSIIAFVTLTMLQSTQLRLARDNAELRRAQAEQVTLFLKDLFRQSDPVVARGQDLSARDLLDRGTEELRSSMDGQPLMKAELLGVLADIRLSLNDYPAAESLAKQAFELRASNAGDVAASHEQMARIRLALADFKGVLSHVDAVVKPGLPLAQASDRELRLLIMRVSARTGLGAPPAEACEALEALTAEAVRRYGPEHSRTLDLRLRLSLSLGAAGQPEREQQIIDDVTRDLPLAEATNDPELAELALRRAAMARHQGKLDEARRLARWALDVRRLVFGASHSKTAAAMSGLAAAAAESGQLDEAQTLFEEALKINAKLYPPEHAALVAMRYNLGVFYLRSRKDTDAAIPLLETVVADARKSAQMGPNLGRFQLTLARAYSGAGRVDAARGAFIAALALAAANTGPDSMVPIIEAEIQCLDPKAVRSATVRAQLDAVIERLRTSDGPDDSVVMRLVRCRDTGAGD
jgi:serine/threonine-protein kinase